MTHWCSRGLYAVTPDNRSTESLVAFVQAVLRGGATAVQYRCKVADAGFRHTQAAALNARCREADVPLIINDDADLALAVGAAGVHVGEDDGDLAGIRARLGPNAIIGVSCYNDLARAVEASASGASYVAFGAMFPSSVKPAARRASLALLHEVRSRIVLPIAAIGGITLDNAADVIAAGADLLAVITDLADAPDREARARGYSQLFASSP